MIPAEFLVFAPLIFIGVTGGMRHGGALLFWPYVVIGVVGIAGRFVFDALLRANTTYIVTDCAAYVARSGIKPTVRRYGGAALAAIERLPAAPDGTATILLVPAGPREFVQWNVGLDRRPSLDRFEAIADSRLVYEALVAARDRAAAPKYGPPRADR